MFVTSSELAPLLASKRLRSSQLEDAVRSGAIVKEKVEGIWLYHSRGESLNDALALVERILRTVLYEYFIITMPMVVNMVAKRLPTNEITWRALKPIVRRLLRGRRISAIGVLTSSDFQPYLAVHLNDDREAIATMIDSIARRITSNGLADMSVVPDPSRELRGRGWKQTLLAHGEFLGLGAMRDGSLVSWSRL
jgi:hypothetical protein